VVEFDAGRWVFANDLERKVLVDVGSFKREGRGGVESILLVFERRIGSVLVDRRVICEKSKYRSDLVDNRTRSSLTEGSTFSLVHEELVSLSSENNVPRVNGSTSNHKHGNNTVGNEDLGAVFGSEILDDRIVGGRRVVTETVDNLKRLLVLGVDSIENSVVFVEETVRGAAGSSNLMSKGGNERE